MEAAADAGELAAVPAPPSESGSRDWSELPLDAIASVFAKLGAVDILMGAGLVCHSWLHAASKVPYLWRHVDMTLGQASTHCRDNNDMCVMATAAVDRSGGMLESFAGEGFVNDDLLEYIGDRAPLLKSLRVVSCYYISHEGFAEATRKFPLLEELELEDCDCIGGSTWVFQAVGKACPRLRRFTQINGFGAEILYIAQYNDDEALGIAKGMHGLRHLLLSGNLLTNVGLTAILDSCPELEYLELCRCNHVTMDGAMRAKCDRIKTVKLTRGRLDAYMSRFLDTIGRTEFRSGFYMARLGAFI